MLGPNGAGKTTLMLHLNALLTGSGRLEVAGLRVGGGRRPRPARPGRPDLPGPRRPALHADRARGRRLRPAQPRAVQARGRGPRRATALGRRPHGRVRRPRAAPALARPAPARRDRHRARHGPEPARARRAIRQPRSAHPPRADRDARRDRAHAADRHPRPAARRTTLRARRPAVSGPDRRRPAHPTTSSRDEQLLAAHDLELPDGFDLSLLSRPAWSRSRPAASASGP